MIPFSLFSHSFVHSLCKYLMVADYLVGSVLEVELQQLTRHISAVKAFTFCQEERQLERKSCGKPSEGLLHTWATL